VADKKLMECGAWVIYRRKVCQVTQVRGLEGHLEGQEGQGRGQVTAVVLVR
jgi:hypothetical protein